MEHINELPIETIKSQQLVDKESDRYKTLMLQSAALIVGQYLLRSSMKKSFKPLRFVTGGGLLYLAATGDVPIASWVGRKNINHGQINFKKDVLIQRPLEEVYAFFSDFSVAFLQIPGVKRVKPLDVEGTHWQITLESMGMTYTFEVFIVKQIENELIGWSTGENSIVYHSGKVDFSAGALPGSTLVKLVFSYTPPLGKIGRTLAIPLNVLLEYGLSVCTKRLRKVIEAAVI